MAGLLSFFRKRSAGEKKAPGMALSERVDLRRILPYGDILGDGAMQLSFTLPLNASPEAREAAKKYVEKMGLSQVQVVSMESMGSNLSFFVVYGHSSKTIDFTKIKVPKAEFQKMEFDQINQFALEKIRRRLVVVGATTGTDAHTVGIDAIMNMKGYKGDYGLERYPCFRTHNLRSQVRNEELVQQAVRLQADAILVSKVVTQRGKYQEELKELVKMLKSQKNLRSPLIKIAGGPRMTHAQAKKLGYDAGFGPGTLPSEVASFIVQTYARRI